MSNNNVHAGNKKSYQQLDRTRTNKANKCQMNKQMRPHYAVIVHNPDFHMTCNCLVNLVPTIFIVLSRRLMHTLCDDLPTLNSV